MSNNNLFFLLFLLSLSCTKEDELKKKRIEEMILENVELRIEEYISIRNSTCREQVIEEAIKRAGSVLLEEARKERLESLEIEIPNKPEIPPVDLPKDFNPLKNKLDSIKPTNIIQWNR